MTDEEKNLATSRRLASSPRCDCGDRAVICPENQHDFVCPNSDYPYGGRKCFFREWLYGPKSHWPKPKETEKKKKERKHEPILCRCGVEAQYGLVPSELGVGYFCGHMVDYDEDTRKCTWEYYRDKDEVKQEIRSNKLMGEKMRCGSQLIDSYIKHHRKAMRRFAEELRCNSPMRVERRKRKAANEKRAQEAREMTMARAAKEDEFMSQAADEAEAAYYKRKADEASAGASLFTQEEEDEFISQAADVAEAAYYKRMAEKGKAGQQ